MSANPDRGELDVEIGGQVRTLRFRIQEIMMLERSLGSSAMDFCQEGNRIPTFVVTAIYCGLLTQDKKLTLVRVQNWVQAFTGSLQALARLILLAVASGTPGEDGKRQVAALRDQFSRQEGALDLHDPDGPDGAGAGKPDPSTAG